MSKSLIRKISHTHHLIFSSLFNQGPYGQATVPPVQTTTKNPLTLQKIKWKFHAPCGTPLLAHAVLLRSLSLQQSNQIDHQVLQSKNWFEKKYWLPKGILEKGFQQCLPPVCAWSANWLEVEPAPLNGNASLSQMIGGGGGWVSKLRDCDASEENETLN